MKKDTNKNNTEIKSEYKEVVNEIEKFLGIAKNQNKHNNKKNVSNIEENKKNVEKGNKLHLFGSYGCGKTTIINEIKTNYIKNKKIRHFNFLKLKDENYNTTLQLFDLEMKIIIKEIKKQMIYLKF